ncbi:MAG: HlyD family efflux transporter periplasmic adaptor subunit [Woeseiaceae bacterium]
MARIRADSAGVVETLSVPAGTLVRAGDSLVALGKEQYLPDGRSSGRVIGRKLLEQIGALDRQIELLGAAALVEGKSIRAQLASLDEQQRALSQEALEQRRRLQASNEKLSRLERSAERGATAVWDVLDQKDERAALIQLEARIRQSEVVLDRERERLNRRAQALPLETERSTSSLLSEKSQLQQEITGHESGRRVVLKSPIAGKLASIEVREGESVVPNQLLATVLPADMSLTAEVYVPSSAVAFIKPGQSVRLKYDAFPQAQFGTFDGEVANVSDFILMPSEVPQTFSLREATFKVQIAISAEAVELETGITPLRPGMLLAAEIVLESRRLIDWLFEPLRLRRRVAA